MKFKNIILIGLILFILQSTVAEGYIGSGAFSSLDVETTETAPEVWYLAGWDGYYPVNKKVTLFFEGNHQGVYSFDPQTFDTITALSADISYRTEEFLCRWAISPELLTLGKISGYSFTQTTNLLISFGNDYFTLEFLPEGIWYLNDSRKEWHINGKVMGRFSVGDYWLLSPFLSGGGDFLLEEEPEPFYALGLEFNWYPGDFLSMEGELAFRELISGNRELLWMGDSVIDVAGYYGYKGIGCNLNIHLPLNNLLSLELELPVSYKTNSVSQITNGEVITLWRFSLLPDLTINFRFPGDFSLSLVPGYRLTYSNDSLVKMNQLYLEIMLDYAFNSG